MINRTIFFLTFILLIGLANKTKGQSTKLDFDNISFNLPILHQEANDLLKLDSNESARKGGIYNRQILLHYLSDAEDSIIGITFYKKCKNYEELKKTHKEYFLALTKKYGLEFKEIDFSFYTSLTGKYYYIQLNKDVSIILGDVMYNRADNNYVVVSFFYGINEDKIKKYLNAIY